MSTLGLVKPCGGRGSKESWGNKNVEGHEDFRRGIHRGAHSRGRGQGHTGCNLVPVLGLRVLLALVAVPQHQVPGLHGMVQDMNHIRIHYVAC